MASDIPLGESDNLESGDLGLGKGLKPGAIEKDEAEFDSNMQFTMLLHTPAGVRSRTSSVNGPDMDNNSARVTAKLTDRLKWLRRKQSSKDITDKDHGYDYDFAPYTEVPIGTSLNQQRHLFDTELSELMKKNGITDAEGLFGLRHETIEDYKNLDQASAEKKLHSVEQEVIILKHDLELCQSQLDTKYKAIKILQTQAYATQTEQMMTNQKVKIINRKLQKEINQLQFQLDHQQTRLVTSQQGWLDKFDRVCQENSALMATVEAQAEEMRKINAEKMGLKREREELLALLDVQERQRFESLQSQSVSDDQFYNFSSLELAVLGSCRCRMQDPEPCSCALKAANLKKELAKVKDQLHKYKERWRDSTIVIDTYRMAFEEQLARNRGLIRKIAELTSIPTLGRVEKAKAAIKWVIKQINDDEQTFKQESEARARKMKSIHSEKSTPAVGPKSQDNSKNIGQSLPQPSENSSSLENPESGSTNQSATLPITSQRTEQLTTTNHNGEFSADKSAEFSTNQNADQSEECASNASGESSLSSSSLSMAEEASANSEQSLKQRQSAGSIVGLKKKPREDHNFNSISNGIHDDDLDGKSEGDLIDMLLDTIYDKSEALTHQRLISRMLAEKTQQLEQKLSRLMEGDEVFLTNVDE